MKALIHQLGTNGAIYLHTGDPSHLCIVYATLDEMTSVRVHSLLTAPVLLHLVWLLVGCPRG